MKFTKMHGLGNDYVYLNCLEHMISDPERAARLVSDRHYGIGGDGLILIRPSRVADFAMDMYNADGSRGEMCGNGIRCVGKYVYDHGLTRKHTLAIETLGGIKHLGLGIKDGKVEDITVNMGTPRFSVKDAAITVAETEYTMTAVSMGNPHAVVFVEDVDHYPVEQIGPLFEQHERFPNRVNTEFCEVIDRTTVKMRVWERGSGETLACGTGACATVVAGVLNDLTEDTVTVKLVGGDLLIKWDRWQNKVFMTGPAVTVFEGDMELPIE